jgi:serine/threonine protein kinase
MNVISNGPLVYEVYEFEKILGTGSYSSVVLGTHNETKKQYAIKIIDKSQLTDTSSERLRREIEINKILDHPNIVKVYEVYITNEDVSFVMELLGGGELFERIAKKGAFPEDIARHHMKSLTQCIQYIHNKGIAHRDLKPENLLCDAAGNDCTIKICDFGFAKRDTGNALETPLGTVAYVAPEVFNQEQYSKSVDMWSLGCILYFMLFGRPPFNSDNDDELEELVSEGKYSFPTSRPVSDDAKDLVSHLLDVNPLKRYSAAQILEHRWIKAETESVAEQLNNIRLSNEEIVLAKNAINKAIDRERLKEEKSNTVIAELPVDKPQDSPLWAKRQAKKKQQAEKKATPAKATDAK